jgi:hypothetical protein
MRRAIVAVLGALCVILSALPALASIDEITCPPTALEENELCGESNNGGCHTLEWMQVDCGVTVCGTAWAENAERDTDWFDVAVTESCTIVMTITAEFEVLIGYVDGCPPGSPDCSCQMGIDPFAVGGANDTVSIEVEAIPGNYWFWIAPIAFYDMPCGGENNYVVIFDCGDEDRLCGDADGSGNIDIDDAVSTISYIFGGGVPLPPGYCDANCDDFIDIDDAVYLLAYIFSQGPAPCTECLF